MKTNDTQNNAQHLERAPGSAAPRHQHPARPCVCWWRGVSLQSESGEGRALKPVNGEYQIYTADDLKEFAAIVNGTDDTPADNDADARLMNDIDLNPNMKIDEDGTVTNGDELAQWTPIGNSESTAYTGTFDGNGKTISGLYINNSTADDQGLFGYVGSSGTVQNLSVSGTVSGRMYVGGVVGDNRGNVINCAFSGSVSGSGHVGGVVGYNNSSVENCYNTGSVNGSIEAGGVVGLNSGGNVENCYNIGEVSGMHVGGVVGYNDGPVKNCYNTGKVTGSSDYSHIGGVVGYNHSDSVIGCYFLTGTAEKGIGSDDSATGATAVDDLNELCQKFKDDTNTWTIHPVLGRPVLNENKEGGLGTKEHPYEIKTAAQLENFRDLVNDENGNPAAWAVLMENITLNSSEEWEPIGNSESTAYTGTFDGQNFKISGLYIDSSGVDYKGLFGFVGSEGTVQNLTVTGSVSGNNYVGGIAGQNGGRITDCAFSGNVNVSGNYVGGVVGDNYRGSVENCYNIGEVSGNISGGVVGLNDSGTVENCHNIGEVSGNSYVGGVVGYNIGIGNVKGCYFLKTADVNENLSGIGEGSGTSSNVEARTDDAFHSGEVAWLLQAGQADGSSQVWGQSNLKDKNSWPTLVALDKNAKTVYQVTLKYDHAGAQDKTYYTDDTATPSEQPSRDGYTFDHWDKTEGEGNTITYTAKWTPHTYSITASPSALDFGSITEGEERPAAQTVIITNSGNDGASATLTASFTVKEPPYTGKYSYELSTSVGDHGSLTVDRYVTEGEKVTITVTPDEAYKLDDLSVTANGKDVELTANSDGTYTFTMPSADVRITATFAEDPDWTEPEEPTTDVSDLFIDIAPDAWYKDAIQYAYDNGLMTGVSATEFAPEQTTTRAMIVSILARLEGVTTAQAAGFADVDDNDWYATAVNWAANVGVVNGYEDNTFQPNTAITREQLAAILMNYAAYKGEDVSNRADLASYTDQPSTWAEETMSWAVAEGLITGVTADTLQPQGAATRAQVAAILQRFLSE